MTDEKDTSKHDPITDGALNTKLTPQDIEKSIVHITHDSAVSGDEVDWHTICSHPKEQRSDDILLEKIERIVELEKEIERLRNEIERLEKYTISGYRIINRELQNNLMVAIDTLKDITSASHFASAIGKAMRALARIEQTNMGEVK